MPTTDLMYQVICSHFISKREKEVVVIIPITEKEEKQLDTGSLTTTRNDQIFNIESNQIICYGEINFHTNSDDYDTIEQMKWFDYLDAKGISIPSDYDYEEHCCYTPNKKVRWYETFNPAVLAQYYHARLNKPQRVCIFKEKKYVK